MGVDTASGKLGANESVATILSIHTGKQVAIMAGKFTPEEMAGGVIGAGHAYAHKKMPCEIAVEKEYHGMTIINKLIEVQYPNIYAHDRNLISFRGGATEWGWDARKYRQTAIDWLQRDIGWSMSGIPAERKRAVFVNDKDTSTQLMFFKRNAKTGRPEAVHGKYDDRVSALYIANWVRRERMGPIFDPPVVEKPYVETWQDRIVAGLRKPGDRDAGPREI